MTTGRYRLSSLAEQDITAIVEYIARDDLDAALRMVDRFTESFGLIASNPRIGRAYQHPRGALRRLTVGRYLVFYQPRDGDVLVIRVLHDARLHENLL